MFCIVHHLVKALIIFVFCQLKIDVVDRSASNNVVVDVSKNKNNFDGKFYHHDTKLLSELLLKSVIDYNL